VRFNAGRKSSRQPPKEREPKKVPLKKTLQEECRERLAEKHDLARHRRIAEAQQHHDAEADAVAEMMYGPGWRQEPPAWVLAMEAMPRPKRDAA
jgi:hypothetical protein